MGKEGPDREGMSWVGPRPCHMKYNKQRRAQALRENLSCDRLDRKSQLELSFFPDAHGPQTQFIDNIDSFKLMFEMGHFILKPYMSLEF